MCVDTIIFAEASGSLMDILKQHFYLSQPQNMSCTGWYSEATKSQFFT